MKDHESKNENYQISEHDLLCAKEGDNESIVKLLKSKSGLINTFFKLFNKSIDKEDLKCAACIAIVETLNNKTIDSIEKFNQKIDTNIKNEFLKLYATIGNVYQLPIKTALTMLKVQKELDKYLVLPDIDTLIQNSNSKLCNEDVYTYFLLHRESFSLHLTCNIDDDLETLEGLIPDIGSCNETYDSLIKQLTNYF